MPARMLHTSLFLAAAGVALPLPPSAHGSSAGCDATAAVRSEADAYDAWARAALGERESWLYAARMLEKSASMRDSCDARAVGALVLAGRIYHHLGQLERARLTLVAAAERAVAAGHPAHAAHLYLDAGLVAVDQDYPEAAVEAVIGADRLRSSPSVTEAERRTITARIVDQRTADDGLAATPVTPGPLLESNVSDAASKPRERP